MQESYVINAKPRFKISRSQYAEKMRQKYLNKKYLTGINVRTFFLRLKLHTYCRNRKTENNNTMMVLKLNIPPNPKSLPHPLTF